MHYRRVFGDLLAELRSLDAGGVLGCHDSDRVLAGARPMTAGELVMAAREAGVDWEPLLVQFSEGASN